MVHIVEFRDRGITGLGHFDIAPVHKIALNAFGIDAIRNAYIACRHVQKLSS